MNILILGGTGFLGTYMRNCFNTKFSVDFSYANQVINDGIKYQVGKDLLHQVINKKYEVIINNINPLNLSYTDVVACTEDLIAFCSLSNSKLIHISSVSSLYENRFSNGYNLKKAIAEDLILTEMQKDSFTILRFTQLFDSKGLSRKSQAGLYYLLKEIKQNNPISLFINNKECYRNYMPVEYAIKMIATVIDENLNGVFNAHLDAFTLSFDELLEQLARLNEHFDTRKLIKVGNKIGLTYHIANESKELVSFISKDDNLFAYFKEAYNNIQ